MAGGALNRSFYFYNCSDKLVMRLAGDVSQTGP